MKKVVFKRSTRSSPLFPTFIIAVLAMFIWKGSSEINHLTFTSSSFSIASFSLSSTIDPSSTAGLTTTTNGKSSSRSSTSKTKGAAVKKQVAPATKGSLYLEQHGRCPPLSKELFDEIAVDNTIMLSVATANQHDFMHNWIETIRERDISYAIVAAIDEETSKALAAAKMPCFEHIESLETHLNTSALLEWGRPGWVKRTWSRPLVLDRVIDWNFRIIVSDLDVVWFRNPIKEIPAEKDYVGDLIFSHDGIGTKTMPQPGQAITFEEGASGGWHVNTGLYILYPTNRTRNIVHKWRELYNDGNVKMNDQLGLQTLLRAGPTWIRHPQYPNVSAAYNESVYMAVLPSYIFASGHSYSVSKTHQLFNASRPPLTLHATWTYGEKPGKISRLREAMMWHDDPAYYSEGKYLTVNLRLPTMPADYHDWKENEPMILWSIENLERQFYQIYAGMAMAVATNRTFIFPRMECYCDRIWHAVTLCRMNGVPEQTFPHDCPADYYFLLDKLTEVNETFFGPRVDIREYSFLRNPRTPFQVKDSGIVVKFDSAALKLDTCVDTLKAGKSPSTISTSCTTKKTSEDLKLDALPDTTLNTLVTLPPGLTDAELRIVMKPYDDVKVWHVDVTENLENPWHAFGGFECLGANEKFDKRMVRAMQQWCCRYPDDARKLNKPERIDLVMKPKDAKWPRNFENFKSCTST